MPNKAQATIIGHVTRDPELKFVGTPPQEIAEFTVAVNVTKDKVVYYNITAWKFAVSQAKTLDKGSCVYVVGTPEARAYISNKGEEPNAVAVNQINAFEVYKIAYTKKENGESSRGGGRF